VSFRVLWSDSALERASELFDFIAEKNPAAAKRVIEDLFDRAEALSKHPRLGRRLSEHMDASVRRLVLGDYIVVYQIEELSRLVTVLAIRHFRERYLPGEEP
jgi:addiction module RelE/StbE family toxin